jgi:hypothetical protein
VRRFLLFIVLVNAAGACSRHDETSELSAAQLRGAEPARQSLRAVAATVPVTTTPPEDARRVDGVYYIVLSQGFGKQRPAIGNDVLLAMNYISYDEGGVMKSEPQSALQELYFAPQEWRAVLTEMVAGEKRRIWIPEGNHFQVNDLELQSFGTSRGSRR